jgi:thiol-disulfide isomerase/thioredoxin
MSEPAEKRPKLGPRRIAMAAFGGAAVAIAITFWVSNAGLPGASPCTPNPLAAQAIDAAATGQLAALNGTGTGRSYADMGFLDANGKERTVADFAGKKLLINFWASWCIPCRAEMPALNALAAKYDSDRFMVLPVNTGETQPGKGAAFLSAANLPNLALYVDPDFSVINRLKTTAVSVGLPTSVLVDGKGCEVGALQGPAEWDSPDGHRVIEALQKI